MTSLSSASSSPVSIGPVRASHEGADTTGFRSSGPSPTRRTLHLVGPGHVGTSFLQQIAHARVRLVAVSDSTATIYDRHGLDPVAIAAHKRGGRPLRDWPRAEAIATDVAVAVCGAELVADATPSGAAGTDAALARARAALRTGAYLALSGKNALAAAAPELLAHGSARIGINAVLGGTGARLQAELAELRGRCTEVALCGNVTTTVIVRAIERGASVDEGIARAGELGLLEPDPTLDLDGSDAAVKLCAVHGALFGERWQRGLAPADVVRQHVRELDAGLLQRRFQQGRTTRLIARALRDGRASAAFEELPQSSPLAAPPDRVVYSYRLGEELRVHTGLGVGYPRTAAALLQDVLTAAAVAS